MKTLQIDHPVRVGDVFVESWGYDQTNVNFYQVVKVTAKSVYIREVHHNVVGEGHQAQVVPDVDNFIDKSWNRISSTEDPNAPVLKRVKEWRGEPYLTMTSYSNAYLWDGERSYFDTITAGYPGH